MATELPFSYGSGLPVSEFYRLDPNHLSKVPRDPFAKPRKKKSVPTKSSDVKIRGAVLRVCENRVQLITSLQMYLIVFYSRAVKDNSKPLGHKQSKKFCLASRFFSL